MIVFCARAGILEANKVCSVAVVGPDRVGFWPGHISATVDVVRVSEATTILSGIKVEVVDRSLGFGTYDIAGVLVDEVACRVG